MPTNIEGVVAPVLTPFDESGNLQPNNIKESVDYTLECGCHALVAAGTGAQETATMTVSERKTLLSKTMEAAEGEVPVLAGISHPAQPVVTELIEHAEQNGADAVLAMPPWGVAPSQKAILEYYKKIADRTALPILAYNNPSVTVDMDRKTMASIATIDGVEYMKESSRDWQKIGWLLENVHHAGHADLFTTMDVLLPTLQAGGVGALVPPPATVPTMEVYEQYQNGNLDKAVKTQRTFGNFPPEPVDTGLTGALKAAAELGDVPVGPPRKPYQRVGADGEKALQSWMEDVNIPRINVDKIDN